MNFLLFVFAINIHIFSCELQFDLSIRITWQNGRYNMIYNTRFLSLIQRKFYLMSLFYIGETIVMLIFIGYIRLFEKATVAKSLVVLQWNLIYSSWDRPPNFDVQQWHNAIDHLSLQRKFVFCLLFVVISQQNALWENLLYSLLWIFWNKN